MTTIAPARRRFRWRRSVLAAGMLSIAALLLTGESIRRESRRRWLETEVASIGGNFEDSYEDQTWRWKIEYWYRFGEYPRLRRLHFNRRIDPDWLRARDYLRGLEVTDLQIRNGAIAGDDLAQVIEAQPLDTLHLIDETLSPRTFAAIAGKRGWKRVQLSGCNLTDEDLGRFDLRTIESLAVDSTGVTSDGLSVSTRCERLEHAMLGGGQVTPQVARQIAALGTLTRLHLVGKQVTDADLEPLVEIQSLKMLHLVNTNTTSLGRRTLQNATAGRSLAIH